MSIRTPGPGEGKPRSPRIYVDQDLSADAVSLAAAEAHYLVHVLRLRHGDSAVLFNGRGAERHARLEHAARQSVRLSLGATIEPIPESGLRLILLHSLSKSDAMDLVIQKATELGVSAVLPIITQFSVVRLDSERAAKRVSHWQRVAQHACEQCGRHRPPLVAPPRGLDECLADLSVPMLKIVLDPGSHRSLEDCGSATETVGLACGPEGGFSAQDRSALEQAGFLPIGLGPRTLRTETAALVGCALAQAHWGDLRDSRRPR